MDRRLSHNQFQYLAQAREVLRENGEIESKTSTLKPKTDTCCGDAKVGAVPGSKNDKHFCKDKEIASCVKKSGWMRRKSKILTAGYEEKQSLSIADAARLKQLQINSENEVNMK